MNQRDKAILCSSEGMDTLRAELDQLARDCGVYTADDTEPNPVDVQTAQANWEGQYDS